MSEEILSRFRNFMDRYGWKGVALLIGLKAAQVAVVVLIASCL